MTDQYGRAGQLPNCLCHVFDEVGNARPAKFLPPLAVAVLAQVDGLVSEAELTEAIEKVHIPTPGSVRRPVYEKERYPVLTVGRMFGDHCKLHVRLPFTPKTKHLPQAAQHAVSEAGSKD